MTINCNENLIDLSTPKIMGILNVTPDSFFDGGKFKNIDDALLQTDKMLQDGATFIDVGAYSSKPGANAVSEEEELARILPIVTQIQSSFPNCILSIDTFRSSVAKACVDAGAAIINDISGGNLDPKMFTTVAALKVPYILMHMRGTPQNMQQNTTYKNLIKDIIFYFSEQVYKAKEAGINDIIIDPGFGFAKTLEQNYELLNKLDLLQNLDAPILAGLSRKSMIYKTLKTDANNALNGTTALNMVCLNHGAAILRVHDVKEAMECVQLFNALKKN
ncbi:dihydropteroate synthase [Maribacter vaceletii]|uniref:Dihydropteroate synthase n=1 Tax=Maribacter vaceletii TaxID=1206816 RepID=A0A495E618_9FLAO|nr:dihydropteroate synthase [Maribacter vaceletii]RKR12395.1 dihydropteroate synthase [Maribacter vaceletii]